MKTIRFLITYGDGHEEICDVRAEGINSGFVKAAALAVSGLPKGTPSGLRAQALEVNRVEFSEIVA